MTELKTRIIYGLGVAFAVGFGIVVMILELVWLFSPAGAYFNTDTVPLQVQLSIIIDTFWSIWTWVITVIVWPIATKIEPWVWWND